MTKEPVIDGVKGDGGKEPSIMGKPESEFLQEMRERYDRAMEADRDDREAGYEDLLFSQGDNHWPDDLKADRESKGRPCLTINKMPELIDQVTGAQRKMNVTIKVRAADDKSDIKTVPTLNGMLATIAHNSKAQDVYDTALDSSAHCGRGFYRVRNDYVDDESFEQEILIDPIRERFAVKWDPAAEEPDLSDSEFFFIDTVLQKEAFKQKHGEAPVQDWEASPEASSWVNDDEVLVVEYYFKHSEGLETLYLLDNGEVATKKQYEEFIEITESQIPEIVQERKVERKKVYWVKACGSKVLEGPEEIPCKYIPIIPVWGKIITVNGKARRRGIIRFAHDAQRMYNYWRTSSAEVIALQPKAPYIATAAQIGQYQDMWNKADKENFPYLLYDREEGSAPPQRQVPPTTVSGYTQEAALSDSEIRSTTGIHQPSVGEEGSAKSGKAIGMLQERGDTGTFAYIDNLHKSMEYCGRIIVDMIPHIYDTERKIRIQTPSGDHEQVMINSTDEEGNPLNDLRTGRYQAIIDTGPDYATRRLETVDILSSLFQQVPGVAQQAPDIFVRNIDFKDSDELESRLRKPLLASGVVEPREGEEVPQQQEDPLKQVAQKKFVVELAQEEQKLENLKKEGSMKDMELEEQRLQNVKLMYEIPGFAPGVADE